MADDPEVIPPEKSPQTLPSITINQFFQLVNQNRSFPDAETLGRYTAEDREWIKERVEVEQQNRHELLSALVQNEHQNAMATTAFSHRAERERQYGAIGIITLAVVISGILLKMGMGYYALALPPVVMLSPIATGIANGVLNKIRGGEPENPTPASTGRPKDS